MRWIYRTIPAKDVLFRILKKSIQVPKPIWTHLYFEGEFSFYVTPAHPPVRMINYNSSLETEIFWGGVYCEHEPISQYLWARLCCYASNVVDVGANTGLYSLIACAISPTSNNIYSFEPVERIYRKLVLNLELNGFVAYHERCAIGDVDSNSVIYDLPLEHHQRATLDRGEIDHLNFQIYKSPVVVKTLSTLISEGTLHGIDLLKIDVEGYEPLVLRGLDSHLRTERPNMIVEIKSVEKGLQIQRLVDSCNYRFFAIDESSGLMPVAGLGSISPNENVRNFLLIREELAGEILSETNDYFGAPQ